MPKEKTYWLTEEELETLTESRINWRSIVMAGLGGVLAAKLLWCV